MEHSFQFSPPKFCVLPLSQECPMSLLIPQSNFVLCEFHHARGYRVVQRGLSFNNLSDHSRGTFVTFLRTAFLNLFIFFVEYFASMYICETQWEGDDRW